MPSLQFHYLTQGDFLGALSWIFTSYIGYGLMWLLFGGLIFAVVQTKTQSYGISGFIFIIYSVIIASLVPVEMQPYLLLFTGLFGAVLLYGVLKA